MMKHVKGKWFIDIIIYEGQKIEEFSLKRFIEHVMDIAQNSKKPRFLNIHKNPTTLLAHHGNRSLKESLSYKKSLSNILSIT